ncbi:MAG TPA: hypothetical protein VF221_04415 [Chloroflexota bacterium]
MQRMVLWAQFTPWDDAMFRQKVLDRLSSPEELDQLMHITNPRLWLALVGVLALLVAGVLWTVFTTVSTTVSAQGALVRGTTQASVQPVVFATVQDGSQIHAGQSGTVTVHNAGGTVPSTLKALVASVDPVPADERGMAQTLHNAGYAHVLAVQLKIIKVQLTLTPPTSGGERGHAIAPGTIVTSSITVDRQSPIHLIIP